MSFIIFFLIKIKLVYNKNLKISQQLHLHIIMKYVIPLKRKSKCVHVATENKNVLSNRFRLLRDATYEKFHTNFFKQIILFYLFSGSKYTNCTALFWFCFFMWFFLILHIIKGKQLPLSIYISRFRWLRLSFQD